MPTSGEASHIESKAAWRSPYEGLTPEVLVPRWPKFGLQIKDFPNALSNPPPRTYHTKLLWRLHSACERTSRIRSSILSPTNTCYCRSPEQRTRLSLICSVLICVCWIILTHKLAMTGWIEGEQLRVYGRAQILDWNSIFRRGIDSIVSMRLENIVAKLHCAAIP